jgi:hypothetical protein
MRDLLTIVPLVGLAITSTLLSLSLINERRNRRRDLSERVNSAVTIAVNEKLVTLFFGIFQAREQLATYVKEAESSARMLEERVSHGTSTLDAAVARVDASIQTLEQLSQNANELAARLQEYAEQASADAREVSETKDRVFAQAEELLLSATQQFDHSTARAEASMRAAGFDERMVTVDLPIRSDPDSPVRRTTISCWTDGARCLTFSLIPGAMVPDAVNFTANDLRRILEGGEIDQALVLVFDWDGDDRELRAMLAEATADFPSEIARAIAIMKLEALDTYLHLMQTSYRNSTAYSG